MNEISADEIVDTLRSAVLVLDRDLRVTTANRAFERTFRTSREATVGRPLYGLGNGQWDIPGLRRLLEQILPDAGTIEAYEVEHSFPEIGRKVMTLNARKVYRPGNHVEHILLVIDDVTEAREAALEAERARLLAESIVDTVRDPLVVLEHDMTVALASRAFLDMFALPPGDVVGRSLYDLGAGQWDISSLRGLLDRVVPDASTIERFEVEDDFAGIGRRTFQLNARKLHRPGNHVSRLLVMFEDVTEAREREKHKDMLAAELAHRIKNSLQIIASFVSFELRRAAEPCREGYRAMQARIGAVAELYDMIASSAALGPVAIAPYLDGIACNIRNSLLGLSSGVTIAVEADALVIGADHAVPLGLIVNELATNAVKYAFPDGRGTLRVVFRRHDGHLMLTVADDGVGMGSAAIGGSGLGSRFIEAFVRQVGGTLATATGETGTMMTVRLPNTLLAGDPG